MEEFIDEVEHLLRTRPTSNEEKVDFISHLEGAAREELLQRKKNFGGCAGHSKRCLWRTFHNFRTFIRFFINACRKTNKACKTFLMI